MSRRASILRPGQPRRVLQFRSLPSCTGGPRFLSYSGSDQRQDQRLSQQPHPGLRIGQKAGSQPADLSPGNRFVIWMSLLRRRPSTTAILARPLKFAPIGSGFISAVTLKGRLYVTEFDIGEFFIHGDAREVDGEFQAVIIMRAKPPLTTVTTHQVEKDRWFKTVDAAATAAKDAAKALKSAVDSGALNS